MKIIVENEQEKNLIVSMCDIALRTGGIKNMAEVQTVVNSISEKPKEKPKEK